MKMTLEHARHVFSIGFDESLVPLVLSGEKKYTYRLGDKFNSVEIGQRIPARISGTDNVIGILEITEKTDTIFRDLPIDKEGHEQYKSKDEQRATFEKYYGQVNNDDRVIILGFKLVNN